MVPRGLGRPKPWRRSHPLLGYLCSAHWLTDVSSSDLSHELPAQIFPCLPNLSTGVCPALWVPNRTLDIPPRISPLSELQTVHRTTWHLVGAARASGVRIRSLVYARVLSIRASLEHQLQYVMHTQPLLSTPIAINFTRAARMHTQGYDKAFNHPSWYLTPSSLSLPKITFRYESTACLTTSGYKLQKDRAVVSLHTQP